MIVSCEQCQTQFRLDDSKVPEGGARVRCSKCHHAFFIAPPGQADDVTARDLAREALETGRSGDSDDPESDWQFNHDAPPADDAGHGGLDAGHGELDAGHGGLDAAREAVDDLLGGLGPASPAAAPTPEVEGLGPEPEIARPPAPEPAPAAIESPDSWNLLDEGQEDAEPDGGAQIGRVELVPRWKVLEQEREEEQRAFAKRAAAAAARGDGSGVSRAVRFVGGAIGWAATLALLAAGTWAAVQRGMAPPAKPAATLEAPGFRAEDVRGRWVDNAVAGPIYLVSGRLHAEGTDREQGGLAVRLLDARGEPIAQPTSPVGPPFPPVAVREHDPAQLRASQARAAHHFAWLNAGETAEFQAVFEEVPPDAARFDLTRTGTP